MLTDDDGTDKILLWQDIDPVLCNSLQVLQDFVDEKQAIVSDASMVRERRWDLPTRFLTNCGGGFVFRRR